ncbi:FimF protein [Escherichia coli]|uniref:FimF protein n=1 Tax=Escherichia coli TaxID=562 RepID=A0A376TMU0_ECOLX|nr:FimF protein [Escherichia coli]
MRNKPFYLLCAFLWLAVSHALAADSTITIAAMSGITAVVWPLNQPILLLI